MANYVPSNWIKAQVKLNELMASPEKRFRDPAVFRSIVQSNRMFELKVDRTREDRPTEAYYKLRSTRSLGTGRSHDHTGTIGDSGVLTPSWVTRHDVFTDSLKLADNNIFNAEELFMNEIENVVANFAEGIEVVSTDFIFNERSQVNTDASGEGAFDGVGYKYDITEAANGNRSIQITKSVMVSNKYTRGQFVVYCDTVSFNKFQYQANQGSSNSENLSFQFSGMTFIHSVEMDAKAAALSVTKGFWIAAPFGTYGVADWIPVQNRQGITTSVNKYGTLINPVDGLTYATHSYEARFDGTATNGYTQDVQTQHEISIDLTFDKAPLSVANESTFQAFALV